MGYFTSALLLAAALLMARPAAAAAQAGDELQQALRARPDETRGQLLFQQCTACHGPDGGGRSDGMFPRLAGQHASVIIEQLVAFRSGRRWDLRMEQMAEKHHLADAQAIADVAAYASRLNAGEPAGRLGGLQLDAGARAYLQYCTGCHGSGGQGSAGQRIPRLAGQHAAYLLRQMQEAASSGRPNMSASHVALLNRFDFPVYQGIADYLARQTPSAQSDNLP